VPINIDGRRYAVFFTAQQRAEHVERDGMGGAYFPDLYDWLKGRRAYAELGPELRVRRVNDFLRGYAVAEEFDPAGIVRAGPRNEQHRGALVASRGRAEQEIVEAIEAGRPGFAGGWVSSQRRSTTC
jgi:hypothetical protein